MTPITTIMTADPTTIDQRDSVSDAIRALQSAPYHHLVVMDGDAPVGMVSNTDIVSLLFELDRDGGESFLDHVDRIYTIEDVMTPKLHAVPVTGTLTDAAVALSQGTFHSVVVLEGERLVGIVTTTDLARYIVESSGS